MTILVFLLLCLLCIVVAILLRKFISLCLMENQADWGRRWLNVLDGFNRILCNKYHRQHKHYVALPKHGAAVVVANHISGLDPFLLIAASKRPLRFMIAREEYERFGLTWLFKAVGCIPVDRKLNPIDALHEAIAVLDKGEVVAMFPHGGIQWPIHEDNRIKGGAIRIAQRKRCSLYPIYIHGVKVSGTTFLALFGRSRIEIDMHPPISCVDIDYQTCMDQLLQILNVRRSKEGK